MSGRRIAALAMVAAMVVIAVVAVRIYWLARESPAVPASASSASSSSSPAPAPSPSPSPTTSHLKPSPSPSPTPAPPPGEPRKTLLDGARTSGPAKEKWDEQARTLFNSLAQGDTIVAYEGCYVAGCAATLSFATEDDYRRVRDDAERSDAYRAWTGGKKWSRPEPAEDGRVLVALVVYRPD